MKRNRSGMIRIAIACILTAGFVPAGLIAQMSARGLGMGGAYVAVARGVHAPKWNPANLGLPDNPSFSMDFISVEAGAWNNSFNLDMYNQYNGEYLTDSDIDNILSQIPDAGFASRANSFFRVFSFSAGRFALSIGADAGAYLNLDKTFFDIPLTGTSLNESYSFGESDGRGLGVGLVGLSWGQPLVVAFADAFAVGGTLNILYSGGYAQTDQVDFTLLTNYYGIDLDGDYEVTYAYNGGVGWSLDLGAAAQIGDKWTFGLSLSNLFGSLPFSDQVETEYGVMLADSLTVLTEDFDEAFIDSTWSLDAPSFRTHMPTILRMGISYLEGPVLLSLDYRQGFVNGGFTSTKPRFAVGTEWCGVKWLPLRMGVVLGGQLGFGTSFGLGIRPGGFVLDLAILNRGFISPNHSKGAVVALDLGVELFTKKFDTVRVDDL